jgi:anti-sigma regulatory factor (Ser/Thr protein kinase)
MKRRLEFTSHPANLASMREFVGRFLADCAWPPDEATLVILGLDEACTNIIRYAYLFDHTQPIVLTCERLKYGLRFRLRDFGTQCDPAQIVSRPLQAVRPGGLGVHLIRHVFDRVQYTLRKRGTELRLVRYARRKRNSKPSKKAPAG